METYFKPIIQDDTPDVVILHIGCNDISNKNISANDIAEGSINIGRMNRCKNYGLGYIDNSNIEVGFLAQDGLHLNEIGESCLANNFINFINRYIL